MSREAWGDPPDPEPQRCPVCDGEWHAEGCELGEEVSRRLKAETEARTLRCRYAVVSGWIVEALKVLDTLDPEDTTEADELHKLIKAGEVLALTALAQSKTPNAGLGVAAGSPVDGGNEAATLHSPASRPAATPPKPRAGLAIPVVLDDGWIGQLVIPRDMSRAEMLRMRRVLWTLAVPWR